LVVFVFSGGLPLTDACLPAEPAWKHVEALTNQGETDRARSLAERHLSQPNLDELDSLHTMARLMELSRPVAESFPGAEFRKIVAHSDIGWYHTNPSIHPTSPDRNAYVRNINYRMEDRQWYIHHPERIIETRPGMVELNATLGTTSYRELVDKTEISRSGNFYIQGFEDWRLFSHEGSEYAVASIRNTNAEGIAQQYLLTLDHNAIARAVPLSTVADGTQKNWMPVVGCHDMTFVDSCSPRRIRKHDPESGTTTIVIDEPSNPFFSRFRGGSQLVPWLGGFLAVVHENMDYIHTTRLYLHRFVFFDSDLHITHCSDQFWFAKRGIEFCAGLRHESTSFIASFGIEDREAWLVSIPEQEIWASLRSVADRTSGDLPVPDAPDAPIVTDDVQRTGIVSVTLAHAGREDALGDALRSVVDHVDTCLIINTDDSDGVDQVARSEAGDKCILVGYDWVNDFAAARNASLAFAATTTAAWALIVDSDERMHFGDTDLGAFTSALDPEIHTLSTSDNIGSYSKVRMFRLPVAGSYVGATHEYFDARGKTQHFEPSIWFSERGKDEAEGQQKYDRDLEILKRETRRRPMETRGWYYLGDTLARHDRHHEAIEAFRRCADLQGWNEEAAWACYREAQCWLALDRPDLAVSRCAVGIGLHPAIAELPWLAGFASWKAGRYRDAIAFSNLAIVHGEQYGLASEANRVSFRHLPALYEGPFDVLRYSYRSLGDDAAADQAEQDFQTALANRTNNSRHNNP
jgi:tetratricopeptide (TPR) repeat protein